MREWLVTADDRTGALEAAAEIAAWWGPVTVTVDEPPAGDGVVDLASRHLTATAAVQRLTEAPPAHWVAHKIDSTLRGNWAAEVRARARALGRPAVVVAAWPKMGRTCEGGLVRVHGAPRAMVTDQLPEAEVLPGAEALDRWLAARRDDDHHAVAAVDVLDDEGMVAVAHSLRGRAVLVAGPAGPIGAAFGAHHGVRRPTGAQVTPPLPTPALVVRGSATEISRAQVAALDGITGVDVLEAPPADGELHPGVALELAGRVHAHLADHPVRTLVLVGGDTAAAVLGAEPRLVGGTVAPGLPWSSAATGGPLVVTKAGGFGSATTLVDLFVGPGRHRAREEA